MLVRSLSFICFTIQKRESIEFLFIANPLVVFFNARGQNHPVGRAACLVQTVRKILLATPLRLFCEEKTSAS